MNQTKGTEANSALLYKLLLKLEINANALQANVPVELINILTVFSKLPLAGGHKSNQNKSDT